MEEHKIIGAMWSKPAPEGKVKYWVDDEQGGGWIEYVTPEEAERRDKEAEEQQVCRERCGNSCKSLPYCPLTDPPEYLG